MEKTVEAASKVVARIVKNDREPGITTAKMGTKHIPALWPGESLSNNTEGLFGVADKAVAVGNFFKVEEGNEKTDF
jgi:hypothetical protein